MTVTEVTKSAVQRRTAWLAAMTDKLQVAETTSETLDLLAEVRRDGPDLARLDFWRWQRWFLWSDRMLEQGKPLTWILVRMLLDLSSADRYSS